MLHSIINVQNLKQGASLHHTPHITINIAEWLDNMSLAERKEFVSSAVADGELLKQICRQIVAKQDQENPNTSTASDILLDDRTIGDMRTILAQLIGPAAAEELQQARAQAEKAKADADAYRSLVHVWMLLQCARNNPSASADYRTSRYDQWQNEINKGIARFPDLKDHVY